MWEAVAGINLVQVADDGSPIGTAGNQQGDPRFGDIRIGGMAQSGGQLAFAFVPPPFNGGTDAGDIFFNTSQWWQTNGTTYDLETVAIHELGHALGMGHSAIATADMYASYGGTKQALTSDDTTGIQSIYGTRPPDAAEQQFLHHGDRHHALHQWRGSDLAGQPRHHHEQRCRLVQGDRPRPRRSGR